MCRMDLAINLIYHEDCPTTFFLTKKSSFYMPSGHNKREYMVDEIGAAEDILLWFVPY